MRIAASLQSNIVSSPWVYRQVVASRVHLGRTCNLRWKSVYNRRPHVIVVPWDGWSRGLQLDGVQTSLLLHFMLEVRDGLPFLLETMDTDCCTWSALRSRC